MNEFAELARIVTNHKSKKIDHLFDDKGLSGEKYRKLATEIAENPDLTEDDTAKIIGADKSNSTYRMFKIRFREKLLNSILISDLDLISSYSKTSVLLNRNAYCIRVLIIISARSSAIDLAEQTLKKSIEFQFWDVAIYCCTVLYRHQAYTGDKEKFNFYVNLYNQFSEILLAENKAIVNYESSRMNSVNTLVFNPDELSQMEKEYSELEILKNRYNSYQLGLYYYRVKARYYFSSQNYNASVDTYDEMIAFLDDYKHFEYNTRIGDILLHKMFCFLYLHDFKNGIECARQCNNIFKRGHNNWFVYNELSFIISMHTQNYKEAGIILENVSATSQFKFQTGNIKERWKLFEAYYFVLLKAGVAEPYANARFRFSSFLNSITIYNKDKKGFNTSILIVELIYHMLNKEFHIITDKMEAVQRYSKRHFEDNPKYRSNIFLKMLIECEKCGYHKDEVLKKTRKMHQQLADSQFTYISSLDGLEIVPFLDLWEIVTKCLD